jgi:hypothetical protein
MLVYRPPPTDSEQSESTRKLVKQSRKLLMPSAPNTFFGRKTQEPFPQDDDEVWLIAGA